MREGSSKLSAFCDELTDPIANVRASLGEYQDTCQWGTFDMSGPLAAVDLWIGQSRNDVQWLNIIAAAFEAAGVEGQVSTLNNVALSEALSTSGVDISRSTLQIESASISGINPTTGYANDPVNVATGNFVLPQLDLVFSGPSRGLTIERTYNSVNEYVGVFGLGWHSRFDERLDFAEDLVRWFRGDGFSVEFERHDDTFERGTRSDYWLEFGGISDFPWA